jgi:hypothetical protein
VFVSLVIEQNDVVTDTMALDRYPEVEVVERFGTVVVDEHRSRDTIDGHTFATVWPRTTLHGVDCLDDLLLPRR